jgi:hypothetical protein
MISLLERAASWNNSDLYNDEQKQKAETRVGVCNNCDSNTYNAMADYYFCKECECPLRSKLYTPNAGDCPRKLWSV